MERLPTGRYLTDGMRLLMVCQHTRTEIVLEDCYTDEICAMPHREFAAMGLWQVGLGEGAAGVGLGRSLAEPVR